MSLRPFASLAVKLLGLYTLLQSLISLALIWSAFIDAIHGRASCSIIGCFPEWRDVLPGLMLGAFQIAVGIGLWLFSDALSVALVKEEQGTQLPSTWNWRAFSRRMLGAFLLIDSAANFVGGFLETRTFEWGRYPTHFIFAVVIRCGVGLFLLWGLRVRLSALHPKNWGRDTSTS